MKTLLLFVITWLSVIITFAGFAGQQGKSLTTDIGIFNTGCGEFEIRAKPITDISGTVITNIQFTVSWPENTVNFFNFSSFYAITQQGPVYQSDGLNYAVFISATPIPINWIAGNEYVLLSFFHDKSGIGFADFEIADDLWTQNNNGSYYFELLGIDYTGIIYHQALNVNLGGCGNVDIGIFNSDCAEFEVRVKPTIDLIGSSVTNIQFTLRWPENTVDFFNFTSDYLLMQQGPVYQTDGFNYAIFISATPIPVNWTAGIEYVIMEFSHDQSGAGYEDITISNDIWAQTNNGMFYIEMLGLDETGSIYHQAFNSWFGTCGTIDIGIFNTDCAEFEVRLKPHDNYPGNVLTNLQFTVSWPAGSVGLITFNYFFDLQQQGPVYTYNGTSYAIFISVTPIPINWTAETEYTLLTFSHDQSGSGYGDFLISSDTWTQNNNGVYYVELLGLDKTGEIYHQAGNAYLGECGTIDIGLFNTGCADFEVRLKPHVDYPGNTLTNVQFTIKWPANTVNLIDFISGFAVMQQGPVTVENDTNYAVFVSATPIPVNWTAEMEYTILTFSHDQSSGGYGSFLIDTSTWAQNNNGDYYVELLGIDYTGVVYNNAEDVYLGECGIVDIRVILQGPCNFATSEMHTTLNTAGVLPSDQPYANAPWNYTGTEYLSAFPDSIVDWVLVELRDKNDPAATIERKAGLLSKTGMVLNTGLTTGLYFAAAEDQEDFYLVVWHRNHMPVMSGLPVSLPNLGGPYDFTEVIITQSYKHNDPLPAMLELDPPGSGKYGMIAGDINANKELKYIGSDNDRALILQRMVMVSGSTNLNVIITGYYNEDINLDNKVMYIGSSNDRGLILSNLIKLTGSPNLNSIYNSIVP